MRIAQQRIKERGDADLRAKIRKGIALGPIYPTILKRIIWRAQGFDRITQWRQRTGGILLCAMGGFSVERAAGAFAAGADMFPAVTDITLNAAPEHRIHQWLRLCQ